MVRSALLISAWLGVAGANEHAAAPAAPAHHAEAPGGLPERPAPISVRDYKVPRTLIERLEAEYARELKKPLKDAKPEGVKRALLGLAVDFTQAEPEGALEAPVRLVLQPGGGALDLASVVGTRRAAFNVRPVPRDLAGAEIAPSRVYFISRARVRTLDGERYGDGCGKLMDLTSAFRERFLRRGFDVYSTERRYLSTLGGTFLFARFDPSALQVATVTFTDARYPQLLCE